MAKAESSLENLPAKFRTLISNPAWHPCTMAQHVSGGRWKGYAHLHLLADKLLEVAAGVCPRLMVQMPPRHGKSLLVNYFCAWYLGLYPDRRVIVASYESDLAASLGRRAREIFEEHGREFWGLSVRDDSKAAHRWDIADHEGGMITAGARGAITGRGAHLGVIDDPIRDEVQASSPTFRNRTWDWYLSTFSTRLQDGGSIILIQTRWHEDDLSGRLLQAQEAGGDQWDVIQLPAIAEEPERIGPWSRDPGEALCPQLIPLEMLEATRERLGPYWWATLYQQRPYPRGGGLFQVEGIEIVDDVPPHLLTCRGWDLAASLHGKQTAGVLLAKDPQGGYFVLDSVAGKWQPGARDQIIQATASRDGYVTRIAIEQEPGSGGVAQVHALARALSGYTVEGIRATGSKEVRAGPLASQINVGNVKLLRAPWNASLLAELESFPTGEYCDQVDALSHAFGVLAGRSAGDPIYLQAARMRASEDDWRRDGMFEDVGRGRGSHWSNDFPG